MYSKKEDVIQLTLTLKMTTAQVVETSVSVNNNVTVLFRTTFTRNYFLNDSLVQTFHINTFIHLHAKWAAGVEFPGKLFADLKN